MKVGLALYCSDETIPPDELAVEVEQRGFECLLFPDHSHIPTSRVTPWPGSWPLMPAEPFVSNGLFVVFEGGEGAGKSTQLEELATRLRDASLQKTTWDKLKVFKGFSPAEQDLILAAVAHENLRADVQFDFAPLEQPGAALHVDECLAFVPHQRRARNHCR